MPYYNRDPNRDHNFDNHPCRSLKCLAPSPDADVKTIESFTAALLRDSGLSAPDFPNKLEVMTRLDKLLDGGTEIWILLYYTLLYCKPYYTIPHHTVLYHARL